MSDAAVIKVNGVAELGNALIEFGNIIASKYLARSTYTAAAVIEADAFTRAPVLTGEMRDHVAIFKRREGDKLTSHYAIGVRRINKTRRIRRVIRTLHRAGLSVRIEGDPFYWYFVEKGTSHQAAEPFLRPALESQTQNAIEAFRVVMADGVIAAANEARA